MPPDIAQFEDRLSHCMVRDQYRIRRRLRGRNGDGAVRHDEKFLAHLRKEIERSVERRANRARMVPLSNYPAGLPIVERRGDISSLIAAHQVVILCGETGSGKTTQLPKICLELGRGVGGVIGHTQPRRIAARSVAARIAEELKTALGRQVGYKVRFTDKTGTDCLVKIMTDGILLAETQNDPLLLQYDTLIIDEAHERSLNIDFLLGYLKRLLPRRPDLKLIVTSATIDPQRFSRHFNDAPIIEVSGRTYPVEVLWRPVQGEEADEEDPKVLDAIVDAVEEVAARGDGDVLIFLSGEREIRETADALAKHDLPAGPTEVIPLYARLSTEEQNRVFQPHAGRRIVLATNVAETSLTVPGIRYVIDPGFARISRYSANARVQRLPIENISRASADQRKGRCGRVASGTCIRLYTEEDYQSRPEFTDPEILRANLASVILQMKALNLGAIEKFPFLEPPRLAMVREGYQTLHELGAVDEHGELTPLGRELARLPVDPRIGRMVLAADHENCLKEVLVIASALATQDPRLRPLDAQAEADAAHAEFADEDSDFLSYLKLWNYYHAQAEELSSSKLRKLCQSRYLSFVRLREWHDVHQQLQTLVTEAGMKLNTHVAAYEDIHRALLTGLLGNVGCRSETREYQGVRERKFNIFPGSGLFKGGPRWIMAGELVETNRLYARTVARIHPEWIEPLAGHIVKRTYTAPQWNSGSAHVEAFEKVTLHGLVIVPRRRVHYGKIDPELARETFILAALVEGDYIPPARREHAPFFVHNRGLIESIRDLEAKSRRRDVLVDPEEIYRFYAARIPAGVHNGPAFEKWRRSAEREEPRLLFMTRRDLMRRDAADVTADLFPDQVALGPVQLPLQYSLEPGEAVDGVTLVVPVEALQQVHEDRGDWLVPGLLREKLTALIRSLPKDLRKNFVPAPEYAAQAAERIEFGRGMVVDALGEALHRIAGIAIPREAWRPETLPEHLRMNYRIVDAEGAEVASGRDLMSIKRSVGAGASGAIVSGLQPQFERTNLTTWDFGDLPERIEVSRGGVQLHVYPALVDEGDRVSLRLFGSQESADETMRGGVRRLFLLQVNEELKMQIDYLPGLERLLLHYSILGPGEHLCGELVELIADRVFVRDEPWIRTEAEFNRRLTAGRDDIWPITSEVTSLVSRALAAHHAVRVRMAECEQNPLLRDSLRDVTRHLQHLMPRGWLLNTPWSRLQHFPRYLDGILVRLEKLSTGNIERDRQFGAEIAGYWLKFEERAERHRLSQITDPALQQYRWMIEEMRVSLFAQELKTSIPVSAQRLEKQWGLVRA